MPDPEGEALLEELSTPLLDREDEDLYIPRRLVKYIEVFRMIPVPAELRKPSEPTHRRVFTKITLPPHATLSEFATQFGGGRWWVQGRGGPGDRADQFVAGRYHDIEGAAAPTPAPGVGPGIGAPIMETPSGLAGIPGLDPSLSLLFVMLQQNAAMIRADAHKQIDTMAAVLQSAMGRPAPEGGGASGEVLSEFRQEMARIRQELQTARAEQSKAELDKLSLAVQAARLEAGRGATGSGALSTIVEAIAKHAPVLADTLVAALSNGKIQIIAQMPPGDAAAAAAAAARGVS